MSTTTLIIVIVLLLLCGRGGFWFRGRYVAGALLGAA